MNTIQIKRLRHMRGVILLAFLCMSSFGLSAPIDKKVLEKAQNGDSAAIYEVAQKHVFAYDKGKKAFQWLEKCAATNNSWGLTTLAGYYWHGYGTSANMTKSVKLLRKAAEQDYGYAMLALGYVYENSTLKDDSIAAYWYFKATEKCEEWDLPINCDQFCIIHGNTFFERTYTTGGWRPWTFLCNMAEKGNRLANRYCGDALRRGHGCVTRQIGKCIHYYEKAGAMGDAESQKKLAYLYFEDIRDKEQGEYWMKRAAENGNTYALLLAAKFYKNGGYIDLSESKKDYAKSLYYEEQLFNKKIISDSSVYVHMGDLYAEGGPNLQQDGKRALEYYQRANCKSRIGKCYYYGIGVKENPQMALQYFYDGWTIDEECLFMVAVAMYEGKGIPKDYDSAFKFFSALSGDLCIDQYKREQKEARMNGVPFVFVRNGYSPAMRYLSLCYRFGRGCEQNLKLAEKWFEQAAEFDEYTKNFNEIIKNYE